MSLTQAGILADETEVARFLMFSISEPGDIAGLKSTLLGLADFIDGDNIVVGLGQSILKMLGSDKANKIPELRTMPAISGPGFEIPSTPGALWCWLRGKDKGELFHQSREVESLLCAGLSPVFQLEEVVDSFQYQHNRDMSGYEDGTENPTGDEAFAAAIVQGQGPALDGSSFVALQQWVHDFDLLDGMEQEHKDNVIGRRLSDNEELDDAPETAHVKRTAQESFTEGFEEGAFLLRRSMPWADGMESGLYFVAFGHSFAAFEAQMKRMVGDEDGIVDALFSFTRPITGSYFWCPPMKNGKLNLDLLFL